MPREGPGVPHDNVYISELPLGITDEQLRLIFLAYGKVLQCKVLPTTSPGQTKSVALVRFDSVDTASWVVANLNGNIPTGLTTPVQARFADLPKPKGEGGERYSPYGGGGHNGWSKGGPAGPQQKDNLYVKGVPPTADDTEVKQVFSQYGTVLQCRVFKAHNGQSVAALVRFATEQEATWVKEKLSGTVPQGFLNPVDIQYYTPKSGDRGGGHDQGQGGGAGAGAGGGAYGPAGGGGGGGGGVAGGAAFGAGGGGGGQWVARGVPQKDNLYIKGLPPTTDETEVKQVFAQYGAVVQCRVFKGKSGETVAALVRYASEEEAVWVKDNLNGNVPQGYMTPVEVNYYTPKTNPDSGKGSWEGTPALPAPVAAPAGKGKGAPGGGGGKVDKDSGNMSISIRDMVAGFESSGALPGGTHYENNEACLYVGGLPAEADDFELYRLFSPFGAIAPKGVKCMTWPDGTSKGFGFINFLDVGAAQAAIAVFNNLILPDGNTMIVKVKDEPKRKGTGKGCPDGKGWKGK